MSQIRVYDSVGAGSILSNLTGTSLVVVSVADMVEKVLTATDGQRYKSELFLMGTGRVNFQSVGAGSNIDSSGNRSLRLSAANELAGNGGTLLPRLGDRIHTIHLTGVNDANGRSRPLLAAVARALGSGGRAISNSSQVIYQGNDSVPLRHAHGR